MYFLPLRAMYRSNERVANNKQQIVAMRNITWCHCVWG